MLKRLSFVVEKRGMESVWANQGYTHTSKFDYGMFVSKLLCSFLAHPALDVQKQATLQWPLHDRASAAGQEGDSELPPRFQLQHHMPSCATTPGTVD